MECCGSLRIMTPTVYLNGEYMPSDQAKISIFDRAVLFGDAIYEVAGVIDGKLINFENHYHRMVRSLGELSIPQPLDREQILQAYRQLVIDNQLDEGFVYMQITRGVAQRDFHYSKDLTPNVFMFAQLKDAAEYSYVETGVELKSVEDIRWARRDIKSVNLLGQVMAKQIAHEAGAHEALLIAPDGYVTECGSTSFYIVSDNKIITRPLTNEILPGMTRKSLLDLCQENGHELVMRAVTLEEVLGADEAFITGASTYVLAVNKVDGHDIGSGAPGPVSNRLREIYIKHARETAI